MDEHYNYSDFMDIIYKNRLVTISFDVKYKYTPAKKDGDIMFCHDAESDIDYKNLEVAWENNNFSNTRIYSIKENDRNWKRLEKFIPEMIKEIYEEFEYYEPKRYIRS